MYVLQNTFYDSENTNQRPHKYLSINIFHTQYTSLNEPIAGNIQTQFVLHAPLVYISPFITGHIFNVLHQFIVHSLSLCRP